MAWVLAGASRVLPSLLGVAASQVPLLTLTELHDSPARSGWLGRTAPGGPDFAVGLDGVEEQAALIYLVEEATGEPGGRRRPDIEEGGFRPGLHAVLRSDGSAVGHAVAAAMAIALATECGSLVGDPDEGWLAGEPGDGAGGTEPFAFEAALVPERAYSSLTDGAAALWARRPGALA